MTSSDTRSSEAGDDDRKSAMFAQSPHSNCEMGFHAALVGRIEFADMQNWRLPHIRSRYTWAVFAV